jgi:flagellar secretion chaperone FliS
MTPTPTSAYRHSAGQSATPVHLVVMLYEQLIHDLQRALTAMSKEDIEGRTGQLIHALLVLGQLHGTLDFERGGEVAANLDGFYNLLRGDLLEAHIKVAPEILRKHIGNLLELREAWIEVDRRLQAPQEAPAAGIPAAVAASGEKAVRWSG